MLEYPCYSKVQQKCLELHKCCLYHQHSMILTRSIYLLYKLFIYLFSLALPGFMLT